jgi:hypothetical protein
LSTTQIKDAEKINEHIAACMHMQLRNQSFKAGDRQNHMGIDRYIAEPIPGMGVIVSAYDTSDTYHVQFFSTPGEGKYDLFDCYLAQILRAGTTTAHMMRFIAHDLLTLKCLIEETANNWSKANG